MTSFTICVYVCVGERVRVYVRSGVRREYVIKLHNLPCVHVHHSSATEVLLFFYRTEKPRPLREKQRSFYGIRLRSGQQGRGRKQTSAKAFVKLHV